MLTACGESLSGTYLDENADVKTHGGFGSVNFYVSYRFTKSHCYRSYYVDSSGEKIQEESTGFPYKIEDGKLNLYFGNIISRSLEYKKDGNSIFINGREYKKQ